jgi:hypothetical protein
MAARTPERCSDRSERLDEPLLGSASTVRNWLLIENAGPWGRTALRDSRLPPEVGIRLQRLARESGVRTLLIRRPGRSDPDGHHVLASHTGPGTVWLERGHVGDVREVFDLDLSGLAHGQPAGLDRVVDEPLYLACTHGRRDVCCAEKGRPLAAELSTGFPEQTWESSHIGGDRFAGNLVCFPHGVYYGRVAPRDAWWIAAQYADGVVDLDHYRGRSCYGVSVQAAETFLRRHRALTRIDDVRLVSARSVGLHETRAVFAGPTELRYLVRVRTTPSAEPRALTCSSVHDARPPAFELLEIGAGPAA